MPINCCIITSGEAFSIILTQQTPIARIWPVKFENKNLQPMRVQNSDTLINHLRVNDSEFIPKITKFSSDSGASYLFLDSSGNESLCKIILSWTHHQLLSRFCCLMVRRRLPRSRIPRFQMLLFLPSIKKITQLVTLSDTSWWRILMWFLLVIRTQVLLLIKS